MVDTINEFYDLLLNICLMGEYNVGRTTLMYTYTENVFHNNVPPIGYL